jgi:hypothetical protein
MSLNLEPQAEPRSDPKCVRFGCLQIWLPLESSESVLSTKESHSGMSDSSLFSLGCSNQISWIPRLIRATFSSNASGFKGPSTLAFCHRYLRIYLQV